MLSQEEAHEFFQRMSHELENLAYPVLNDLKTDFPGLMWEEEIVKKRREEEILTSDEEMESDNEN